MDCCWYSIHPVFHYSTFFIFTNTKVVLTYDCCGCFFLYDLLLVVLYVADAPIVEGLDRNEGKSTSHKSSSNFSWWGSKRRVVSQLAHLIIHPKTNTVKSLLSRLSYKFQKTLKLLLGRKLWHKLAGRYKSSTFFSSVQISSSTSLQQSPFLFVLHVRRASVNFCIQCHSFCYFLPHLFVYFTSYHGLHVSTSWYGKKLGEIMEFFNFRL